MKLLRMANPVTVAKGAAGLAGTAVGVAETITRESAHLAQSGLHRLAGHREEPARSKPYAAPDQPSPASTVEASSPAATGEAPAPTTAATPVATGTAPAHEPSIVLDEPHAPEEPPVDVVGRALAAEAALGDRERPEGAGVAHEPKVASHDEEHGDAPLQRVEAEEMDDEVAAALEGELEGDLEPEEHLTEPLLDPADAQALAAELRSGSHTESPHLE